MAESPTSRIRPVRVSRLLGSSCLALLLAGAAGAAGAVDLVSPSHRIVGGRFPVAGSAALTGSSPAPAYLGGGSAGQAEAIGFSGSAVDLTTLVPGLWPLVAGDLPLLDGDGDGVRSYEDNCLGDANPDQLDFDGDTQGDVCDADDDGDGLPDVVETGTGVFVSASDTGTGSLDADSDDDGYLDGEEVLAGSDPNDAQSTPLDPVPVPMLGPGLRVLLLLLLPASALAGVRRKKRRD